MKSTVPIAVLLVLVLGPSALTAQRRAAPWDSNRSGADATIAADLPATSYIIPSIGGTLLGGAVGGLVGIFALENDPAITFTAAIAGAVLGSGIWIGRRADSPRVGALASLGGLVLGLAASAAVHDLDDVASGAPLVAIPIGYLVGSVITAGLVD